MSTLRRPSGRGAGAGPGWEGAALRWLAYPANLAFAGIAGFVIALGVVTWLCAAVALVRALQRWLEDDLDTVFTTTFRELAATWRRTLPLSIAATVVVALVVADVVFLVTRSSPWAVLLLAALVPLAALGALMVAHLPAAAALARDGSARQWLRLALGLVVTAPARSAGVLVVLVTWVALCTVLPTLVPVLGLSVPGLAALVAARRTVERHGSLLGRRA